MSKFFNEGFGNRLYGAAWALFLIGAVNNYSAGFMWLATGVLAYFFWFGTSRFDGIYRKLI
jgi:hypothetical protein